MIDENRIRIVSEDYADIMFDYRTNPPHFEFEDSYIHVLNQSIAIVHIPLTQFGRNSLSMFEYYSIPYLFGLTSEVSLEATNLFELRRLPNFDLYGNGVLIGVIDTGIDYTNPVFRKTDGTTKIASIWDQSIQTPDGAPFQTNFGTEYNAEQINQALNLENPLDIVPSMDDIGHGTMLAAIAAGSEEASSDFAGVAPNAELVVVKLKRAKRYLMDFYSIREDAICFQENSIMWGVQYCVEKARELNRPIAIVLGVGTSQSSHDGRALLSIMLSTIGGYPGIGVAVSAGNEGNLGRHYYGVIDPEIGYNIVELNVSENDKNFFMELWGMSPGIYTVDILSPGGEFIPRIAAGLSVSREVSFIFEETRISLDYKTVETLTGDQLILFRFRNITPGIWRFTVYGQGDLLPPFHTWLPMGDFITSDTYFTQPDIYTTITTPGNAWVPLTVSAYNPISGTLYVNSSRGFNRVNIVKPELAAPGVNYIAPNLNGEFVPYSGTGVAAAHTAGVMALMLEWGIVRNNQPDMDTVQIKKFLIRGASRSQVLTYPNRDWGYGIIDIFNTFDVLRQNLIR